MFFENYYLVYILGNMVSAYVMYKFIRIFYSKCKVKPVTEIAAYIGYFLLITLTHVGLELPIIVLITNILLLFLITLLYEGDIKKSLLSILIIYFSLMSIEALFVLLTSTLQLNLLVPFQYESAFGVVVVRIASLGMVFAVKGFKNVKKEYPIPSAYWISLLFIPVGTVIMLFAVFMNTSLSRTIIFICIISAILINMFTFYLYDNISALLVEQMNKRISEEQNRYYEYQVEMMQATLNHMRTLRHDLKNRIAPLYPLAESGNKEELLKTITELSSLSEITKEYSKSGNTIFDSIINFKFQNAEAMNIDINVEINTPDELSIPTFDIAVIIGNLIDNALEATLKTHDRWIRISIVYDKGRLIIETANSYDGIIKKEADQFVTRKHDQANHGLGMKSIKNIIDRHEGYLNIDYDEHVFNTKVLIYV